MKNFAREDTAYLEERRLTGEAACDTERQDLP
jgi:hypothetical protein